MTSRPRRGRGKFLGLTALGFLAAAGCANDFDTSRVIPQRGTLGEELYGVLCDRVGAQALHEDLTGGSFRDICHKDASGKYADTVDTSKLPAVVEGAVDLQNNPVPVAQQQKTRDYAVARVQALARRRTDLIAALDATFPDIKVPIKDVTNPDKTKTCNAPAASGEGRLHDELSTLLGKMQDLYNDGTIPQSTEGLARVMNAFKASPEAQGSWARFDARQGYRPVQVALGAARPALAYPRLRELTIALNTLLSPDSNPYDPSPKTDDQGHRIEVPGAANPQLNKLLEVARNELRDSTPDAPLAPLTLPQRDPSGRVVLSRPRSDLEAIAELMYAEDPAFGSGNSNYIVKRDPRGYASIALVNGALPGPFVDMDKDGLADVTPLGQFVTTDGSVPPSPFFAVGQPLGTRDPFGRAVSPQNKPIYDTIDTTHTFAAQVLSDTKALVNPDPMAKHETLMYAMAGARVLFGTKDGSPKTQKQYSPDPEAIDDWKLTHPGQDPPADLGQRPVTLQYDAFHTQDSALLDLVYAFGQMMGDKSFDQVLQLVRQLFTDHLGDVARLAGDGLYAKQLADKHTEAKIPPKSVLWDEMLDVVAQIAKENGLLEDVLRALAQDDSARLGTIFSDYMSYKDRISYDRQNLNGKAFNFNTNDTSEMKTPVDRSKPDTGANRSAMQRFLMAIHDTNGVTACNKDQAVIHAKGIPLLGSADICDGGLCSLGSSPFPECKVFKIDNLATFYLDSIIGKANMYFRPGILRNGILGIGAASIDVMQQSSGIGTNAGDGPNDPLGVGFWDGSSQLVRDGAHPKPTWLNRLVMFDLANDSPNSGDINYTTNHFLTDLQGPHIGTAACPERIIADPDPTAPDASPDGKVHGLRACNEGDWLFQRDQDATMVWEDFGFYTAISPLVSAFAAHGREDLFIALMEVLHKHWADDKGTASECKLTASTNCTKDGAVSYEPLQVEMFASDIMLALNQASKTLVSLQVPQCTATDPKTHACTSVAQVSGVNVLAAATRALVDPDAAKATGLKDRQGKVTAVRNDGTTNPQVTPIYLLLEALNNIDAAFAQYASSNPTDGPARQQQWKQARSQLVDQFLDVSGKNTATQSFVNPGIPKITPTLVDVLRAQLVARCPDSYNPPYTRCAWARDQITKEMSDVMGGPTFAAAMDLMDAIRADDAARAETEQLLVYLLDAASQNDALASMLATTADILQSLRDDPDLTPVYKALADGAKASLVDTNGHIVQRGMVDAQLELLGRISGKAIDPGTKTENCGAELDPNQIITVALQRLVTPMTGADGKPTETPLEVFLDVIADVNRAAPDKTDKLAATDYANIADNVSDFLLNKERGLEQFYEIVRQGTEH